MTESVSYPSVVFAGFPITHTESITVEIACRSVLVRLSHATGRAIILGYIKTFGRNSVF